MWSFTDLYYHSNLSAGGDVAASRTLNIGSASPTLTVNLNASIHGTADIEVFFPTYVSDQKFLGGQLAVGVAEGYGRATTNSGVHNFMVYTLEDVPIGAYDPRRLVNLGLGHWAIDGGGGYTYFD